MLLSGFFPQIVYTPLRGLTNFTVEPRVTRLSALPVNVGISKESDAKIRIVYRRKFYMTVHFFLTLRRHSSRPNRSMRARSEPGNSCALSQASENAWVIVPLLHETSAEWRKCAGFLHLFLSGNRIAHSCSSALNPAIQGVLQQFNFFGGTACSGSLPFSLWLCLL
jgi:hypothetical protein